MQNDDTLFSKEGYALMAAAFDISTIHSDAVSQ